MKCPYPECRKDYNENWDPEYDTYFSPGSFGHSINERSRLNRLHITTWQCRFCHQYFHSISIGKEIFNQNYDKISDALEPLVIYPVGKTKFEARTVPVRVRDAFNEAERCRSVGSLTGAGAALRKAVYALCDDKKPLGDDYREMIENLPAKDMHRELLKQFKWLGDNVTKPGEEKYTKDMVDVALEFLPTIIDGIYLQAEREEDAAKMLAKARAVNPARNK